MPRVPVPAAGTGTELRPLAPQRLQAVDATAGLRQVGDALQRTGQFGYEYAEAQERADIALDQAAVREVDNEAARRIRERLYTGENAFFTLQGFNAANAREGVEHDLNGLRDELLGRLTTPRQRETFERIIDARIAQEETGVARHVATQLEVENRRQSLARISTGSDDAVTHYGNIQQRDVDIGTVISEIRAQAQTEGWSPEVTRQAEVAARSAIHARAIGSMVDRGEIEAAHSARIAAEGDLDPDARARLDSALRGPLLDRQAEGIVDQLLGTLAPVESVTAAAEQTGNVLPRMIDITMHVGEATGGRDTYPPGHRLAGQPIVSPVGARGRMQVMPGTNTDPGFGVRPAQNDSPEERARVGRDYLAAMMQRYGNDPAKAWAAYNAGPGALDAAIAEHGSNWLDHMPQETRDYVRRSMAALGGRGNNPPVQQRPQEHDMTELLRRLDEMNLPFDVEQRVRARLAGRVAIDEQLLARERATAQEEAWGVVENLGDNFTSIDQIPADIRRRMSPQQREQFRGLAERRSRESETDWSAYTRYSDQFATDPRAFARLNPAELRANLGDSEFEQVMGWRREAQEFVRGGNRQQTQAQVTHGRIRGVIDPLMAAAGITAPVDPPGAATAPAAEVQRYNQRVGQFQRAVQNDVEYWMRRHPGQDISDNDIRDIADRELMRAWRPGARDLGGGRREGEIFAFEMEPGGSYAGRVPPADVQRIRREYQRQFRRNPTDDEIMEVYRYGPRGGRR